MDEEEQEEGVSENEEAGWAPEVKSRAKAKAKSKGKSKAAGAPKAKAKAKSSTATPRTCLSCEEPRYRNTRWCALHNRAAIAAKAQAVAQGEGESYERAVKADDGARQMMAQWEKLNPAGNRWKRKEVVDWAEFKRSYGVRRSKGNWNKYKWMTWKQFKAWGKYKQGWDSDECTDEWKILDDGDTERNFGGRKGAEQFYVDCGAYDLKGKENYIDGRMEEGGERIKKAKLEDREALQHFSHASAASASDPFLSGRRTADPLQSPTKTKSNLQDQAQDTPSKTENVPMDDNQRTKIGDKLEQQWQTHKKNMPTPQCSG